MKINWIDEKVLAAGGIPISKENLQVLQKQGVKAIVTLTEHPLTAQKSLPASLFAEMDFDLFHVPIVDQTPPSRQQVLDVFNYLQQMQAANKAVYIHCHAGVGRTGTMLHAIELRRGSSLEAAGSKIKQARPASQFIMLSDVQKEFLEALAVELKSP
jgi:atypical dual specificity phosphatase